MRVFQRTLPVSLLTAVAALSFGAPGAAQAQSQVSIYGVLDVGVVSVAGRAKTVGRGDNNRLGFKVSEDLGGGLSAIAQLEARFEPDTGTTESAPNRPFWQGESRVGLQGGFGTLRVGRGLTAVQASVAAFEPWGFASNRANLTNFVLAGYNGDPLQPGSSQNRWANAVFYNSPSFGGFQVNATVASKEALSAGTPTSTPSSLSAVYAGGPASVMVGWERNAIGTRFTNLAGSVRLGAFKLMGGTAEQRIAANTNKVRGDFLGTRWEQGASALIVGYGRTRVANSSAVGSSVRQVSLGYEYSLSKRTFLYTDAWQRRATGLSNTNAYDVGIHHAF